MNDRGPHGRNRIGQDDRWHDLGNGTRMEVLFEILQLPEDAIRVDVTGSPEEIAGAIRRSLGL